MLLSRALDRSEVPVQFWTREADTDTPGPVVGFRSFQPTPPEYLPMPWALGRSTAGLESFPVTLGGFRW